MKFRDAEKKLKKLYPDKYQTVVYRKSSYEDGRCTTKCALYVDDLTYYSGSTWAEAFRELRKATNPAKLEEIPDE